MDTAKTKKRTRQDFAQWCRENSTPITDFPSREEYKKQVFFERVKSHGVNLPPDYRVDRDELYY
jgi:hypothetical protein